MRLILFVLLNFVVAFATAQERIPKKIYDFKVKANDGGQIDFSKFKGKKLLIVNTTARNDHNHQYAELEATFQKYRNKLVIVGFLAEDFARPPGSSKSADTGKKVYNVTFPLAEKVAVRGTEMAPIYKWLTQKKYNKLQDIEIPGDFEKFLLDEKGKLVAFFGPLISVKGPKITDAIEK